jgi:choline kinase
MKSHGSKSLIELGGNESVLTRQIGLLRKRYKKAEFIVVVGFQADRLIKQIPEGIKIIENDLYEATSVMRSIGLALRIATNPKVLIVYSDLVFNQAALEGLTKGGSAVLVDSKSNLTSEEVGVTIVNGEVTRFSYDLQTKWAQILFLTGLELKLFKTLAFDREKRKIYTSEALNAIIEIGGRIKAIEPKKMQIVEIDSAKDIEVARRIK